MWRLSNLEEGKIYVFFVLPTVEEVPIAVLQHIDNEQELRHLG